MRSTDKHSKSMANVNKKIEDFKLQIEHEKSSFNQELLEYDSQIDKKNNQLRDLIQTCTASIANIGTYNEDFNNISKSISYFHSKIRALDEAMTVTDKKFESVQQYTDDIQQMENLIESFKTDLKLAEKALTEQEQKVISLEQDTLQHLSDVSQSIEENSKKMLRIFRDEAAGIAEPYLTELDSKVEQTRQATDSLFERSSDILANMGNRAEEEHLLAKQVAELEQKRNLFARQVATFEDQIRDKSHKVQKLNNELAEHQSALENFKNVENVKNVEIKEPVEDGKIPEKTVVEKQKESSTGTAENFVKEEKKEKKSELKPQAKPEVVTDVETEVEAEVKQEDVDVEYTGEDEEVIF